MDDATREEFLKGTRSIIERVGWAIINTAHDVSSMSYSVGISETLKRPEIIVFGLPHRVAQPVINDIAGRWKKGEDVPIGVPLETLLRGYVAYLLPVPRGKAQGHMFVTNTMMDEDYEAVQLVWPDVEGRFPWEDDFDEQMRLAQPLLGDPDSIVRRAP